MGVIDELWVRLGLDASKFKAGMAEAKTSLTTWRDETNKSSADMAKWGAAITATVGPAIALGAAVYSMQEKYGAMADQIGDLSMTTGLSTEKIQKLQYAAVLSNDSFSTVSMGINYLTLSMQKAGDATSEAGKAFAALGVSTAGKSPDAVFEDTTAALMGMKDETQRNSIAMTLYGRSWKEMLPFMEEYIQNKEKIQKTPTFSNQELQDLKDAKMAWDDLGNSVTIYTGKALVESQKGISFLLTMDAAYRKLGRGDIGGFLSDAGKEHDRQVALEQKKLKDLLATNTSGTPTTEPPATAGIFDTLEGSVDSVSDAMKTYRDAIDDVAEAQERLNGINRDYTRELSTTNLRDTASVRNIVTRHKWAVEDQTVEVRKAKTNVAGAAGGVAFAGAKAAGITITGPITVVGDKSFERKMAETNRAAGIGVNY